jgi:hypothetical protein
MSNANATAFPIVTPDMPVSVEPGFTKREAFAMAAMQGMSGNSEIFGPLFQQNPRAVAQWAVEAADALLAELAK